jgi:hypothetical protein
MPNWVFNGVNIDGSPEDIAKIKAQLNQPFSRTHMRWNMETKQDEKVVSIYNSPVFAFWNIIKPDDSILNDYDSVCDSAGMQVENNWYNWNVRNWGTKWDVARPDNTGDSDTSLQDEEDNRLYYRFDTAWGQPYQVLLELSRQYPNVVINNDYEEEGGWGGEEVYKAGTSETIRFYEMRCNQCDTDFATYPKDDWNSDEYGCPNCEAEAKAVGNNTEKAGA